MVEEDKTRGRDAPATIPFWRREEFLIAVVVGAFGACVLYLTTTFWRVPPMLSPGLLPQEFPRLMVYVLFALSLILLFQSLSTAPKKRARVPPIVYCSLGMIALFCALATLDLFIGFFFFFLGLGLIWGERRIALLLFVSLALPLGIFLLFDLVLEVRFPRGLLTSLYYDR